MRPSNANLEIPPPFFSSGMPGMPGAQPSLCPVKWGHSSSPESMVNYQEVSKLGCGGWGSDVGEGFTVRYPLATNLL